MSNDAQALTTASLAFGEEELPLVPVDCYLCGSDRAKVLLNDPPFTVKKCDSCGLGYVTPRIPESHLHLIYQTEYFKSQSASDFGYSDYTKDKLGYLKTFDKKARIVQQYLKRGRVLEVGSAAGFFLHSMQQRGFEVEGVEVSQYVSDFARSEFGLTDIFTGLLKDAPLAEQSFDAVAMWDVVEHLSDPLEELKRIRALIQPDGFLFLQTQDIEAFFARLLGRKWQHFKQLEHIHHFSPTTIRVLLDRAGFELVDITHRAGGKYISIDFFVERMKRYSVILHHLLKPARLMGRIFFYLNPRDEMIVVARPKG